MVPDQTSEQHVRYSFIADAHMAASVTSAVQMVNTSASVSASVSASASASMITRDPSPTTKDTPPLASHVKKT